MVRKKYIQLKFLFILVVFFPFYVQSEIKQAEIPFFNKTLSIQYPTSLLFEFPYKPNNDGYFEEYYQVMDTAGYEILLNNLQQHKKEKKLNDWLYYQLLKKSIDGIFSGQKENMRNLFLWFMLNKSEYETQLEFKGKEITVSALSFDLVYGVPQSKGKGGYFIDLTSFGNEVDYKKWEPFRLNFNPNRGKKTKPFSFVISELPEVFESKIMVKNISFSYQGKDYTVAIPVDIAYVEFLNDYPELSVLKHTELVLSPGAYTTLIPFIKEQTLGFDSVQTIRYIMSFCRTGFKSKNSVVKPGVAYPAGAAMRVISAPEEVLVSDALDSEDISVLFYYLAKEILNPEMVLLKYGKQVSVGINLHKKIGSPIMYNSIPFALCDVSENDDTVEIGHTPKSLTGKSPSIMEK